MWSDQDRHIANVDGGAKATSEGAGEAGVILICGRRQRAPWWRGDDIGSGSGKGSGGKSGLEMWGLVGSARVRDWLDWLRVEDWDQGGGTADGADIDGL